MIYRITNTELLSIFQNDTTQTCSTCGLPSDQVPGPFHFLGGGGGSGCNFKKFYKISSKNPRVLDEHGTEIRQPTVADKNYTLHC